MFFQKWKLRRMARRVFARIRPDLPHIFAFNGTLAARDPFLLGFLCIRIGTETRRIGGERLTWMQQGWVLLLVLDRLFGKLAPPAALLETLLINQPADIRFTRGAEWALVRGPASGSCAAPVDAEPRLTAHASSSPLPDRSI